MRVQVEGLPFAHLNLRRNPFGQWTREELLQLALVDLRHVLPRLEQPGFVLQLLGDKGFGKTTHALAIRRRFPAAGYVHIAEGTRGTLPSGQPIIVDEAQRLTWRQVHQLFRTTTPLVLSTHYDFRRIVAAYGRTVESLMMGQRMTAAWLRALLNRRIAASRRGPGPIPTIRLTTAQRLLDEHGPNVRAILDTLYSRFQQMQDMGHV